MAAAIETKAIEKEKTPAEKKEAGRREEKTAKGEEKVTIRLFKDGNKYKDDVFVAVNGERIQIRRGETVEIKKKFAEVLENSMQQDMKTADMIEQESSAFKERAKELNL